MQKYDIIGGILIGASLIIISFSLVLNWHQSLNVFNYSKVNDSLDVMGTSSVSYSESLSAKRMLISQALLSENSMDSDMTSFTKVHKILNKDDRFIFINKHGKETSISESSSTIQSDAALTIHYKDLKWQIEVDND